MGFPDFLDQSSVLVARRLLGCYMVREWGGGGRSVVRIVETEAYDQSDAASHSYRGRTTRTAVMFGPSGHLYVYFTYGMHYCCNVVCGPEGHGAAVLIRATEPVEGVQFIQQRRPHATGAGVTNGPAKLCQALGIDKQLNGGCLQKPPLWMQSSAEIDVGQVVQTTRIGITRARDAPWRFYINGNAYVSRS